MELEVEREAAIDRLVDEYRDHFYGAYANRLRATYRAEDTDLVGADPEANEATPRRTLSKRWRELIHRFYEVDPLV